YAGEVAGVQLERIAVHEVFDCSVIIHRSLPSIGRGTLYYCGWGGVAVLVCSAHKTSVACLLFQNALRPLILIV
ncbi:MAG: hypothetical protein ACI9OO_000855, partial [Bacteroidia bacterium]